MSNNTVIGMCPRCGDSLTNGHKCFNWMPIKYNQKDADMKKKIMLHYLRNPYGADELEFRKARLQAADELERLYNLEKGVQDLVAKIEEHGLNLNEY